MDEFDQAQQLEQQERDARIAEQRQRPARQQLTDATGEIVCRSCYEPMSPERLEAQPDAACCVQCQALYEQWGI